MVDIDKRSDLELRNQVDEKMIGVLESLYKGYYCAVKLKKDILVMLVDEQPTDEITNHINQLEKSLKDDASRVWLGKLQEISSLPTNKKIQKISELIDNQSKNNLKLNRVLSVMLGKDSDKFKQTFGLSMRELTIDEKRLVKRVLEYNQDDFSQSIEEKVSLLIKSINEYKNFKPQFSSNFLQRMMQKIGAYISSFLYESRETINQSHEDLQIKIQKQATLVGGQPSNQPKAERERTLKIAQNNPEPDTNVTVVYKEEGKYVPDDQAPFLATNEEHNVEDRLKKANKDAQEQMPKPKSILKNTGLKE